MHKMQQMIMKGYWCHKQYSIRHAYHKKHYTRTSMKQLAASARFTSTSASPVSVFSLLSLVISVDGRQAKGFFRFCAFLPGEEISRDRRVLGTAVLLVVAAWLHRVLRRWSFMMSAGFFHSGDVSAIMPANSALHNVNSIYYYY